jgi:AraC-like DNA-binding protein
VTARSHLICAGYTLQPHPMLAALPPVLRLNIHSGRSCGLLASIVERIADEGAPATQQGDPGAQALIDQLSSVLLIEFVRAHYVHDDLAAAEQGFRAALRDRHLGAALRAIHDAPHAPWTLTRMARLAGMSRSVFAERFRKQVGESPAHYLTRWRMQRAAQLLRDDALGIQEVMSRVGYASEATFSRAFKRCLGSSPGSYRRTRRDGARGAALPPWTFAVPDAPAATLSGAREQRSP